MKISRQLEDATAAKATSAEQVLLDTKQQHDHDEKWKRLTPRPSTYVRTTNKLMFTPSHPCPGVLPPRSALSLSCRTTAIGIGNAFGIGKTEVAISSAEFTVAAEQGLSVAYASFGNGYKLASGEIVKMLTPEKDFAGVWLVAAKMATRVFDVTMPTGATVKEVQGNPEMFKAVVRSYLANPGWTLPTYGDEANANLIIILDEVQEFSCADLDRFIAGTVFPALSRCTLVVGAFLPSFHWGSGNRMHDIKIEPLGAEDMTTLFRQKFTGVDPVFQGVSLSGLWGGVVRVLVESFSANREDPVKGLMGNAQPVQNCRTEYVAVYNNKSTPGVIFRASIANVPIPRSTLETLFQKSVSLGTAFVTPVAELSEMYLISQPPLTVAAGLFELIDVCETYSGDYCKRVLQDFPLPNWSKFGALTGLAPALRLCALSHSVEMKYDFAGKTVLSEVLSHGAQSPSGCKQLKTVIAFELKLRVVFGGTNFANLNLQEYCTPSELTLVYMTDDHDCWVDNILIIPLAPNQGSNDFLIVFIDSKFSYATELEPKAILDFKTDIQPKIRGYESKGCMSSLTRCTSLLVIASNRKLPKTLSKKLKKIKAPVAVFGLADLGAVFSPSLVPPRYR